MKIEKINQFSGEYSFLSNFFICPVFYGGITYPHSESAYQAQKEISRAAEFVNVTPGQSKRLGRKLNIRSDWDQVKQQIMYDIVHAKFKQNEHLMEKLEETTGLYLEEGNTWGDIYWGVCNGIGENQLGVILMDIRKQNKQPTELQTLKNKYNLKVIDTVIDVLPDISKTNSLHETTKYVLLQSKTTNQYAVFSEFQDGSTEYTMDLHLFDAVDHIRHAIYKNMQANQLYTNATNQSFKHNNK